MAYGEAGSLLGYLHNQSCENPSFQYAARLDSEEQITNIFWADTRMIIAYAHLGDVITFDTTYSTNKEYRPFGVFAGFNHHRETVIFGAALLYDETAESLKWLFQTFLEAHKQKKPKTIFTDQDPAMAKALFEVLPDTFHGLCSWHIMQNGIKHLGYLMKEGSYYLTEFSACMYEHEEVEEFEDAWSAMLDRYNVCTNPWLLKTYEINEKWAKCHMKEGQEVEPPKKANKNSTDKNTSVSSKDQTVPQQSQAQGAPPSSKRKIEETIVHSFRWLPNKANFYICAGN
ncbi:hypothetical protein ACLB2K_005050 [Fragaria x ananassa]